MGYILLVAITSAVVLFITFHIWAQYTLYSASIGSTLGDELVMAARNNDHALVTELVNQGADVNFVAIKRIQGRYLSSTALLQAAGAGHAKMVALLIDLGADPNMEDYDGQMAFHIAD